VADVCADALWCSGIGRVFGERRGEGGEHGWGAAAQALARSLFAERTWQSFFSASNTRMSATIFEEPDKAAATSSREAPNIVQVAL
jgi:hypothetical protein